MSKNIYEAERLQQIQEQYFSDLKSIVNNLDKMISGMQKDRYPPHAIREIQKARDVLLKLATAMA